MAPGKTKLFNVHFLTPRARLTKEKLTSSQKKQSVDRLIIFIYYKQAAGYSKALHINVSDLIRISREKANPPHHPLSKRMVAGGRSFIVSSVRTHQDYLSYQY